MQCQECHEETDELTRVKVEGKNRKLCEDCLELWNEQQEIAKLRKELAAQQR